MSPYLGELPVNAERRVEKGIGRGRRCLQGDCGMEENLILDVDLEYTVSTVGPSVSQEPLY